MTKPTIQDFKSRKYIVKQLKQILKQYLTENNIKDIKISKLKKTDVIIKIVDYEIFNDVKDLPEPIKSERSKTVKTTIKQYTDEEQEQFLNKGYEVINPLKPKKDYYNPKTGNYEYVKLLKHQEKFLRKFFLSGVNGSIVFHGVGTGKSLTASVATHYYLSLNPDGNVIFISPPALILNFVNALKQFGLDEKDRRIQYFSFEKFTRNSTIKNKKCLFIIDEAHLLRTEIKANEKVDENENKVMIVEQNKRGYAVLEAIKKTDKCILLTGTPFINKLYDIENLLSMVVKKDPLDPDNFASMITRNESRRDYFKYKISHYENEVGSEFFPTKIEKYVPIIMNEEEQQTYNKFEKGDTSVLDDENLEDIRMQATKKESLTAFFNGVRQYSNLLDYKKIGFIIERIQRPQTTGQFIIYTTFIDNGLRIIRKYLNDNNISYAIISGNENIKEKEASKNKYNSKEVQVLLITKAGTEGIDTIGTEAIFIYEGSSWNEPLVEQAVARAIRFKSHYHLPKEQQKVWVYRLLIIKKADKEIIDKINNKEIYNFGSVLQKIKNIDKEIKKLKKDEKEFDEKEFDKKEYKNLSPEQKKKYLEDLKFNRYKTSGDINKLYTSIPSVEARLTIVSLSKKEQILDFILELDENIQQLEDYESPFEKEITLDKLEKMTDKEILELQKKYLEEQKEDIFKKINSSELMALMDKQERQNNIFNTKLQVAKRFQAYFTPDEVIKKMCEFSKKLKSSYEKIEVLEPTAGIGNIPIYIIKNFKGDYHFNLVEIQNTNKKVLLDLQQEAPDLFNVYEEGDFLKFINPIQYDLIMMNPPFHLRKSLFTYLDKDYYDMDFVIKAYHMLKKGGELIALVGQLNKEEYIKWVKEVGGDIYNFTHKNWEDKSKKTKEEKEASTIKSINLSIISIIKKDDTSINEMNKEIKPDLTNTEEKEAEQFENLETSIKNDDNYFKDIYIYKGKEYEKQNNGYYLGEDGKEYQKILTDDKIYKMILKSKRR